VHRVKGDNAVLSKRFQLSGIHVGVRVGVYPKVELFKLGTSNFTVCKKKRILG
jgi:hypothetical protein